MVSSAGKYANPGRRTDYYLQFSSCSKSYIKNNLFLSNKKIPLTK
jgi:hypothetical protein